MILHHRRETERKNRKEVIRKAKELEGKEIK